MFFFVLPIHMQKIFQCLSQSYVIVLIPVSDVKMIQYVAKQLLLKVLWPDQPRTKHVSQNPVATKSSVTNHLQLLDRPSGTTCPEAFVKRLPSLFSRRCSRHTYIICIDFFHIFCVSLLFILFVAYLMIFVRFVFLCIMFLCARLNISNLMYVCTYVCVYVCMYVCICACNYCAFSNLFQRIHADACQLQPCDTTFRIIQQSKAKTFKSPVWYKNIIFACYPMKLLYSCLLNDKI